MKPLLGRRKNALLLKTAQLPCACALGASARSSRNRAAIRTAWPSRLETGLKVELLERDTVYGTYLILLESLKGERIGMELEKGRLATIAHLTLSRL